MKNYFSKRTLILITIMMVFLSGCSTNQDIGGKTNGSNVVQSDHLKNQEVSEDVNTEEQPSESDDSSSENKNNQQDDGKGKKNLEKPTSNSSKNTSITNAGKKSEDKPKSNSKTTYGDIEFIEEKIPFTYLEDRFDKDKYIGESGWVTRGKDGIKRKEVRKVYVDGKYSHTETVKDFYTYQEMIPEQGWSGIKSQPEPWDDWKNKSMAQFSAEVVRLVNAERSRQGLHSLKTGQYNMQEVANIRAKEIVSDYSHNSASGNREYSEAIYKNRQMDPEMAVKGWLNSPGHRKILLTNVKYVAVGVHKVGETVYYVLVISA